MRFLNLGSCYMFDTWQILNYLTASASPSWYHHSWCLVFGYLECLKGEWVLFMQYVAKVSRVPLNFWYNVQLSFSWTEIIKSSKTPLSPSSFPMDKQP